MFPPDGPKARSIRPLVTAFERTAMELTQRQRPFVEIARRAAGRTRRDAISK